MRKGSTSCWKTSQKAEGSDARPLGARTLAFLGPAAEAGAVEEAARLAPLLPLPLPLLSSSSPCSADSVSTAACFRSSSCFLIRLEKRLAEGAASVIVGLD